MRVTRDRITFCGTCGATLPWGESACPKCARMAAVARLRRHVLLLAVLCAVLFLSLMVVGATSWRAADRREAEFRRQLETQARALSEAREAAAAASERAIREAAAAARARAERQMAVPTLAPPPEPRSERRGPPADGLGGLAEPVDPGLLRGLQVLGEEESPARAAFHKGTYRVVPGETIEPGQLRGFVENFIRDRLRRNPALDVICVFVCSSREASESEAFPDLGSYSYRPPDERFDELVRTGDRSRHEFRTEFASGAAGWRLRAAFRAAANAQAWPSDVPAPEKIAVYRKTGRLFMQHFEEDDATVLARAAADLGLSADRVKAVYEEVRRWMDDMNR